MSIFCCTYPMFITDTVACCNQNHRSPHWSFITLKIMTSSPGGSSCMYVEGQTDDATYLRLQVLQLPNSLSSSI